MNRLIAILGNPTSGFRFRGPYDEADLAATENEGDREWIETAPLLPTDATRGLNTLELAAYEILCEQIADLPPSDLDKVEYDDYLRGAALRLAKELRPIVDAFEMGEPKIAVKAGNAQD